MLPAPAPASAAASATLPTPNISSTRGGAGEHILVARAQIFERQKDHGHVEQSRGVAAGPARRRAPLSSRASRHWRSTPCRAATSRTKAANSARRRPCARLCQWRNARSWLHRAPLQHRHRRVQRMKTSHRRAPWRSGYASARRRAPRKLGRAAIAFRSVTALTTRRPYRGSASHAASSSARIGAAADEDRVGRREARKPFGRARGDNIEPGNAEGQQRCARCAPPARDRIRWRWRGWRDRPASIQCRWSRSPRQYPIKARLCAARARPASSRGCRAW